eukprot:GILI01015031.1.p1 GENE.GILI01015031.1~~GILI01015031.1.p1  ORF type:complete len:273 (-),score=51.85 GILI01015031.1:109-927(-)
MAALLDTRVLTVDLNNGGSEYSSINEAIRAAAEGDTIMLRAGSYEEKILLDKVVHIGVDPEAEPGDTVVTSGCIATAPGGSITNLVIHQTVDIRAGSVLLQNCEVTLGPDGIRVCSGATPSIQQCKIHNVKYAGIYLQEEAGGSVIGCAISNVSGDGIHAKGTKESLIIKENNITQCDNGIYMRKGARATVEGNAISTINQFGIYIQSGSDPVISRNQVAQCGIHGIFISKEGNGNIKDNTVSGSVRIYKGCAPVLGANMVSGKLEADMAVA